MACETRGWGWWGMGEVEGEGQRGLKQRMV